MGKFVIIIILSIVTYSSMQAQLKTGRYILTKIETQTNSLHSFRSNLAVENYDSLEVSIVMRGAFVSGLLNVFDNKKISLILSSHFDTGNIYMKKSGDKVSAWSFNHSPWDIVSEDKAFEYRIWTDNIE